MDEEVLVREIVDSALTVHTRLGPGLLESAYETCMVYELSKRGMSARAQLPMAIAYDGVTFDVGYRLDILVNDLVVVELKAIDKLLPIHAAQLLSYLRLGRFRLGILLNFNTVHMRDGIKRVVNGYRAGEERTNEHA